MIQGKTSLLKVFLIYLVLAIVMTFPLAISFHRYPLFDHMDTAATIYNFWWQYYSIFKLHSAPWFNTMINYPDGYSMVLFPLYLTYGIFSWPLQAAFGSPQAITGFFNWISILSFAFTGLLGFLLVKEITESEQAALLAGILFSFLPFHFWHLPRCHTSCLELLILPVLFYFRMLRLKSLKAGMAFGLSLAPLFYQSPNYVIYLTMFLGLNVLYMLVFERSELDGKWLKALAVGIVMAAVLAGPLLFETGKELLHNATPATSTLQEQTRYSANLAGFILPGERELVYRGLGRYSEGLIGEHGVSGKEIFPGYILLASGILGIFLGRKNIKQYGFWLICLLVFFVISLGPYLSAGGRTFFSVPLPYSYLRKIFFFFEMDRSPVRIIILSLLSLTIFSAGFFKRIGQIFSGGESSVIFNILCLLALIELFQVPMKTSRVELPPPYQQIASERGQFTILELPLLPDIYRYSGFFQPYHKKDLAIDLTARKVGAGYADDPMFFYFDEPLRFSNLDPEAQAKALEQIKAGLKRRQIRYIIVYLKFVDDEQNSNLDRLALLLSPQKKIDSDKMFRMYQFDYGDAR